ncbi:MAG TPA: N-acetyltransferase [Streptosporangiaceae bacterium]|nr:N-acetyltransferase [Streptosporangiaceae bacterium]
MPDDAPGFVPDDFTAPEYLEAAGFYLEPLGPQHNDADYRAWTTSMDHIRRSPGFRDGNWPHPMTLAENRGDLERHAADFAGRRGFTYTVLDPQSRDVIGCLYIYPAKEAGHDAEVSSWVRADHASRDASLRTAVREWLRSDWPFRAPHYEQ